MASSNRSSSPQQSPMLGEATLSSIIDLRDKLAYLEATCAQLRQEAAAKEVIFTRQSDQLQQVMGNYVRAYEDTHTTLTGTLDLVSSLESRHQNLQQKDLIIEQLQQQLRQAFLDNDRQQQTITYLQKENQQYRDSAREYQERRALFVDYNNQKLEQKEQEIRELRFDIEHLQNSRIPLATVNFATSPYPTFWSESSSSNEPASDQERATPRLGSSSRQTT